jgi:hypothetical protein
MVIQCDVDSVYECEHHAEVCCVADVSVQKLPLP